jgi:hypothetical protein
VTILGRKFVSRTPETKSHSSRIKSTLGADINKHPGRFFKKEATPKMAEIDIPGTDEKEAKHNEEKVDDRTDPQEGLNELEGDNNPGNANLDR